MLKIIAIVCASRSVLNLNIETFEELFVCRLSTFTSSWQPTHTRCETYFQILTESLFNLFLVGTQSQSTEEKEKRLTNVTRQTPRLISHNLIDLSRDAVARNGPGLVPFLSP